jgi:ABC-type polysaccharide/polyol phosphate export permease
MKQKRSKNKSRTQSSSFKAKQSSIFMPVSATVLFKFIIMIAILIVACIAIILRIFEPVVWTFLGIMAGSVALSINRFEGGQNLDDKSD